MLKKIFIAPVFLLFAAHIVCAQQTDPGREITIPGPPVQNTAEPIRYMEISGGAQHLTEGFGNWRELTVRGNYGFGQHVLQGELSAQRRFNESGVFAGISDTYTINQDYFASLGIGAGDGAFYLPRYRIDGALYRKWLADRSLVTSIGAGYYSAPDGHSDRSLSLSAAYYFASPWIAEGGIRFNQSNPGSVTTDQKFLAVTYGRSKQDLLSARYTWGGEGYLALAANTQMVNFKSDEASVAWRHWVDNKTGFLVNASRYSNPTYKRTGFNIGLFHDF